MERPVEIWLHTVKHTGTHYAMEHLRAMGYEQGHVDARAVTKEMRGDRCFFHLHVEEHQKLFVLVPDDAVVITTLRDPVEVFLSHWSKNKLLTEDELAEQLVGWFEEWEKRLVQYQSWTFKVDDDEEHGARSLARFLSVDDYEFFVVPDNKRRTTSVQSRQYKKKEEARVPASVLDLSRNLGYEPPNRRKECTT